MARKTNNKTDAANVNDTLAGSLGTTVIAPKPAKRKPAKAQVQPKQPQAATIADFTAYGSLGHEAAVAATQQVKAAGNYWDRMRTLYVAAQDVGQAAEAIAALFGAGDKVKGKKAPWYRNYKSCLTRAQERGVTVTNDMGAAALAQALKAQAVTNGSDSDGDSDQDATKLEGLLVMFDRMAKGALNAGATKAQLAKRLAALEV